MELNLHKAMLRTRDRKKCLDKKRIIDMGIKKLDKTRISTRRLVTRVWPKKNLKLPLDICDENGGGTENTSLFVCQLCFYVCN